MKITPAERTGLISECWFSLKLAQIERMRREGADIINLGIGIPDLAPSESTINELMKGVSKPSSQGYQSYSGIPALETVPELNSLSKSHNMAGWRIGMVAGRKEYIQSILKVKSNMDSGMFLPLQPATGKALGNPDSWFERINEIYRRRRRIVEDIIEILGCTIDPKQTGMFLWGRIPGSVLDGDTYVQELLMKTQVFITPGFIYGSNGERYIRISLCADETRLTEAKNRLILCSKSWEDKTTGKREQAEVRDVTHLREWKFIRQRTRGFTRIRSKINKG